MNNIRKINIYKILIIMLLIPLIIYADDCSAQPPEDEYSYVPPTWDKECTEYQYCDTSLGEQRSFCNDHNSKNRGCKGSRPCSNCNPYSSRAICPPTSEQAIPPISNTPSSSGTPSFWSKLDSLDLANNFELADYLPIFDTHTVGRMTSPFSGELPLGDVLITPLKFGNGIRVYAKATKHGDFTGEGVQAKIKPFGDMRKNCNFGTLSLWFKTENFTKNIGSAGHAFSKIAIGGFHGHESFGRDEWFFTVYSIMDSYKKHPIEDDNYFLITIGPNNTDKENDDKLYVTIRFGGNFQSTVEIKNDIVHHLYVVWDITANLSDGRTMRIFIDGNNIINLSETWYDASNQNFDITMGAYAISSSNPNLYSSATIDNLKIWDYVVDEDPTAEFNNGNGKEGWK